MTKYHDIPYLNLIKDVLENGVEKSDRTGVGTIAVFGRQMRFDLSDGTIPILTTKKIHLPSIIHELLWYLKGDTSIHYLNEHNVRIWREWADQHGELGPVYGQQWRSWGDPLDVTDIVFIQPKTTSKPDNLKQSIAVELLPVENSTDAFVGSVFSTRECGDAVVIKRTYTDTKGDHKYTVQFINTGYVVDAVRKSVCKRGHIVDRLLPRVNGVGYLGDYDKHDRFLKQLQRLWYKMLDRCYNKSTPEYALYGGRGVYVDARWHNFSTFQSDVKQIPNWVHKRLNWMSYELDKDYFASNVYSKDTCVWLHATHNTLYRTTNLRPFEVVHTATKKRYAFLSKAEAARRLNIHQSVCSRVLSGKQKSTGGYTMQYLNVPPGTVPRYKLPVDQIACVIDQLKRNPTNRRLIVSSWNPALLPDPSLSFDDNVKQGKQALPPCHYTFQFFAQPYKDTHKLSLLLNMRSNDVGLGNPFNIAQYSILLRMVCEVVGMVPGEFVYSGGDVHIYTNHIDALKDQLTRVPYPSPTLRFSRKIDSIDDFKYDDFVIDNYQFHPAIKMAVAV